MFLIIFVLYLFIWLLDHIICSKRLDIDYFIASYYDNEIYRKQSFRLDADVYSSICNSALFRVKFGDKSEITEFLYNYLTKKKYYCKRLKKIDSNQNFQPKIFIANGEERRWVSENDQQKYKDTIFLNFSRNNYL